jgi:serine phosphatase RsbU (regulator of sigma subunit)
MSKTFETASFLALLGAFDEYVQDYQPSPLANNEYRKYAGVALLNGGFIQVGYDAERYYVTMENVVKDVVKNRRVGETGYLVVATNEWIIVSDRSYNYGQPISIITAESQDFSKLTNSLMFEEGIYIEGKFVKCFCLYETVEGYNVLAIYPESDAMRSRNISVLITIIAELVVFGLLYAVIYLLVKKLVVKNIDKVNESLSQITAGNLDTVVNVRSQIEFDALSNDINATVDTLKRYIKEAAERIDEELRFAKAIQHSVLPSVFPPFPNRKDIEIHASMDTAKEVGGDFYDYYFVDDNHLAFLIADVSGKGIPAAMFMMTAKTVIKSYVESGYSVEEAFTFANAKLSEGNDAHMFVTAWMGVLDTKTGLVTFANAGHNAPLVKHADGTFEYFKSRPGFVLAGLEGVRYRKGELQLQKGDCIYLYTDGVTEAMNIKEELYGDDRLRNTLNNIKEDNVVTICKEVKKDVDLFAGEAEQADDITMVCLKYNGE